LSSYPADPLKSSAVLGICLPVDVESSLRFNKCSRGWFLGLPLVALDVEVLVPLALVKVLYCFSSFTDPFRLIVPKEYILKK